MLNSTCSRCVGHYDANADDDATAVFCGRCTRELNAMRDDAADYQYKITSGDANVRCETPEDARRNRAAIRRRYGHNPGNADTKMVTHRDKRKTRYP